MTLAEWCEQQGRGAKARLQRDAGIKSFNTILYLVAGTRRASYETAKRVSDATGGAVSIAELCEPTSAKQTKRKRRKDRRPCKRPASASSEN